MRIETIISAVEKLENRMAQRALLPKEARQLESFAQYGYENILNILPEILSKQSAKNTGKHIIPRNLYHVTTSSAYENMQKTGKIEVRRACDSIGKQLFMFDIKNFTRFWKQTKNVIEQPRTTLLNLISKQGLLGDGEIVLLKIPSSALDKSKLRIRVQEDMRCGVVADASTRFKIDEKHPISNGLKGFVKLGGITGDKAPLCNQRGKAIEWIYPYDIPIEKVELVGSAHLDAKAVDEANKSMKDMPEVWEKLTNGKPENMNFKHTQK